MKKIFIAVAGIALLFASCNKDKGPVEGPALKPDEQKLKIEETARHLMETVTAQEFKNLAKTSSAFMVALDEFPSDDYDFEELHKALSEMSEDICNYDEDSFSLYYNFLLANLHGKATFGKDKVTFSDYEGTKVEWTDDKNDKWEAELQQVGKVKKFVLDPVAFEPELKSEEPEGLIYITVGIPEKLTVKASVNGKKIADITLTFEVDVKTDDILIEEGVEVYINKGAIKISAEVKVDDLTLKVSPISVNKKIVNDDEQTVDAKLNVSLHMGKQLVLAADLTAKGLADGNSALQDIANVVANVNIMDEIQVEGKLPSYRTFIEYSRNGVPEEDTRSEWEKAVDKLNDLFELAVRYDNTTNVQATLEFEVEEDLEDDYNPYRASPVIVFNDGSRFNVESVYGEDDMDRVDNLMKDIEYWVNSFYALLETYFFE
jgi:hypothetical protein